MTQHLTEKDVRGIATYARIGLTDEEVTEMTVDLNNIWGTLAVAAIAVVAALIIFRLSRR